MKKRIRTRFAPSPTGRLHIGNARTAIMNWLFTRHSEGDFILRIEDTDRERSTEASESSIFNDLRWLGINWDEGPDIGGSFEPYRQSQRLDIYQQYISELRTKEKIYPCYCTTEELEARRKARLTRGESSQYNGRCRNLTSDEKKKFEDSGRKPALRFLVKENKVMFYDMIKDRVTFHGENIGDFILLRPDGMPTYNFACTVDDHLMEISHVIRGDDHVSNTPRQVLIYRAFGWEPPVFAHIPMILGKDRVRLSKRHGATSVLQYREMGYIPEALVNFLSLLSWSSESGEEIISIDHLIEEFDIRRVSKAASVFDVEKLDWMNGVYIRNMDLDRLSSLAFPFIKGAGYSVSSIEEIKPIVSLLQDKVEKFSQIGEKVKIFFQDEVISENTEADVILRNKEAKEVYSIFLEETVSSENWNAEVFKELMRHIQNKTGVRGKNLWMPIRVALTGQVHGPELPRIAEIIGLEKCKRFIKQALNQE